MIARHGVLAALITLTAGCMSDGSLQNEGRRYEQTPTMGEISASQLRLDVFPAQSLDGAGELRALPQTSGPYDRIADSLAVGPIDLIGPGSISGIVAGDLATPWALTAGIPVEPGPVPAAVSIRLPNSVQNYAAVAAEDGLYRATVVPSQTPYVVSVVPDDPRVPFGSREVAFRGASELVDFDLGVGVALYGRVVTGTGEPLQGARVHAVDATGLRSNSTWTDAAGWYVLRVTEDREYTVVCTGRDHGRDPVLTGELALAEPEVGARVDFAYPDLAGSFKVGRVVDALGTAIPDVVVRFTATALDGYGALQASLVVEDTSDGNGSFEVNLVDGEYEVVFLPPIQADPALDFGGLAFATESNGAEPSLGNVELAALVEIGGSVRVANAKDTTVGGAQITCTEVGFGGRSWSTFAAKGGSYTISLPAGLMSCQVKPPGSRVNELAWTTITLDASAGGSHRLDVRPGVLVTGAVRLDGAGEGFSLVEVRDGLGTLLGSTLTLAEDDDSNAGSFAIRVDLPDVAQ